MIFMVLLGFLLLCFLGVFLIYKKLFIVVFASFVIKKFLFFLHEKILSLVHTI